MFNASCLRIRLAPAGSEGSRGAPRQPFSIGLSLQLVGLLLRAGIQSALRERALLPMVGTLPFAHDSYRGPSKLNGWHRRAYVVAGVLALAFVALQFRAWWEPLGSAGLLRDFLATVDKNSSLLQGISALGAIALFAISLNRPGNPGDSRSLI